MFKTLFKYTKSSATITYGHPRPKIAGDVINLIIHESLSLRGDAV